MSSKCCNLFCQKLYNQKLCLTISNLLREASYSENFCVATSLTTTTRPSEPESANRLLAEPRFRLLHKYNLDRPESLVYKVLFPFNTAIFGNPVDSSTSEELNLESLGLDRKSTR